MKKNTKSIFLIHHNAQLKSWISEALRGSSYRVMTETESGKEAAAIINNSGTVPDVVIIDASAREMNIFDAIAVIRSHHTNLRPVLMTKYEEPYSLVRGFNTGISAFLTYDTSAAEFADAIDEVFTKGRYFPEAQWQQLMRLVFQQQYRPPLFTKKQMDVLALVCRDYDYKQMATALKIPQGAVAARVITMLRKTGLHRKSELAAFAIRTGLVPPDAYGAHQ